MANIFHEIRLHDLAWLIVLEQKLIRPKGRMHKRVRPSLKLDMV